MPTSRSGRPSGALRPASPTRTRRSASPPRCGSASSRCRRRWRARWSCSATSRWWARAPSACSCGRGGRRALGLPSPPPTGTAASGGRRSCSIARSGPTSCRCAATRARATSSTNDRNCWILFLPPAAQTMWTRPMTMPGSSISSPDRIRAEQLARLRGRLPQVLRRNRFWRERIHDVRGWDDFERLPLTTKADLVADQEADPPFGTNLTYPLERYVRLHQTSGSSGSRPLRWLDDAESWAWWRRVWAQHVYRAAGVTSADRVFLAFSFGPFIGFWSAFGGAEEVGSLAVPGGSMTTEQRVRSLVEVGATALCSTPTYALRMIDVAREIGVDLVGSPLRVAVHAGEPGASIPATRAAIESGLGVTCFDHTGMTELGPTGVSCSQRDGVHLLESEFVFEVRPAGDGHGTPSLRTEGTGELVATNLGRWSSPLFRYRTGDRVELSREPCSCGSPFVKAVGGLRGRVDDMFTVRGVNLYPSQLEDIVRRHPSVVEFVIEHRRVRQMDEVTLLVECADGEPPPERLGADLRQALGVRIDCRAVPAGTLPRAELKAQRLRRIVES